MSCKHKKLETWYENTDLVSCKDCGDSVPEYVILTKAQRELERDVIGVVGAFLEEVSSEVYCDYEYSLYQNIVEAMQALDGKKDTIWRAKPTVVNDKRVNDE